jgi:hypothetical protein
VLRWHRDLLARDHAARSWPGVRVGRAYLDPLSSPSPEPCVKPCRSSARTPCHAVPASGSVPSRAPGAVSGWTAPALEGPPALGRYSPSRPGRSRSRHPWPSPQHPGEHRRSGSRNHRTARGPLRPLQPPDQFRHCLTECVSSPAAAVNVSSACCRVSSLTRPSPPAAPASSISSARTGARPACRQQPHAAGPG